MSTEALLLAALAAGFFGSGHCIGMCGAVVTLFEQPALPAGALRRRLAYNGGRLATYVLLGTVAGAVGFVLTRVAGAESALMLLRLGAAAVVLLLALNLLFDLRSLAVLDSAGSRIWRRMSPLARRVLPATTLPRAFGAGLVWGTLPCGLVYGAVALAATSGSAAGGAAVMLLFGLGTLPALLAAGSAAARLSGLLRRPALRRAAGAALLVVGLVALAMPLRHGSGHDAPPVEHGPHDGPAPR